MGYDCSESVGKLGSLYMKDVVKEIKSRGLDITLICESPNLE